VVSEVRTREGRVFHGSGALEELPRILESEGWERPLLLTTPGGVRRLPAALQSHAAGSGTVPLVGIVAEARPHVPPEGVGAALEATSKLEPDSLIALGGGAALGLAKVVALETGLPIAALPTTFSGSEMTNVWGRSDSAGKSTGRDDRAAPRVVLYDPELVRSLPPRVAAASGMNSLAHSVGVLTSPSSNPLARLLAREAVAVLAASLPRVVTEGRDHERALWGAHLSARALDMSSMGLHHRLCHILGGRLRLSHARTHAVLLPFTTQVALRHHPEGAPPLLAALAGSAEGHLVSVPQGTERTPTPEGAPTAVGQALLEMNRRLGLPLSLAEVVAEVEASDGVLDEVADEAVGERRGYRIPATASEIRALLAAAWRGALPEHTD
jgi:maleylacetate reductase